MPSGGVHTITLLDIFWPEAPSTCLPSSKKIVDARRNSGPAEPWADTAASTGRLMIAVVGGLADVERGLDPHTHGPKGAIAR